MILHGIDAIFIWWRKLKVNFEYIRVHGFQNQTIKIKIIKLKKVQGFLDQIKINRNDIIINLIII